jgi:hypothetical protein
MDIFATIMTPDFFACDLCNSVIAEIYTFELREFATNEKTDE